MKTWKIAEAKAKFSTVLQDAKLEPQVICRRHEPIAIIMNVQEYEKQVSSKTQTIADMLSRLRTIQETENTEIQIPPREDRNFSLIEE